MTSLLATSSIQYIIDVHTGDHRNAGTDANVRIVLHDTFGNSSKELLLDNFLRNDFERASVDQFQVPKNAVSQLKGTIAKVEVWRDDNGLNDDWYVNMIVVEKRDTREKFVFPVFRWIKANWHYVIKLLDTSLPQFDDNEEQRKMELEEKRKTYVYDQKQPGMPVQVKSLPPDEEFSTDYTFDFIKSGIVSQIASRFVKLMTGEWKSLDDLYNVYVLDTFPKPAGADRWQDDVYFGLQRLNGLNPSVIELCREIPDKLPVTDAMLRPMLEGLTIREALDQKRLFLCDLKILEGVPCRDGYMVCVPIGLFFVNSKSQLKPIAIQLFQQPGPNNPIFLPNEEPLLWLLVKMWYNNADATYHQSLTHLGLTHLLMEGVAIASHRQLSQSHPIFKLLEPHFLYLIQINALALEKLVSENGIIDKTMNCGRIGALEMTKRGMKFWRLDLHGTLPEDLKARGLDDFNILPEYHFRDDATLLYNAIKKYTSSYVNNYYDSAEKLTGDQEIQAWAGELVKLRNGSKGGCGLLGVPGNGLLTSNEQLITILTSVIYTCSVAHAAVNFPQYDEYAFPANFPSLLRGRPPQSKTEVTEKDILQALPDRATSLEIMISSKILSQKGTNSLGDFEVQFLFEEKALEIWREFCQDLARIREIIKERNMKRSHPYSFLDPDSVPNSISI